MEILIVSLAQRVNGWAKRALNPLCLASRAHADLYRQSYPSRKPGLHLTRFVGELPLVAESLHEVLEGLDYRPECGDAVEIVSDPDTCTLVHLQSGDLSTPVPECLVVIRAGLFVHDRVSRRFRMNPDAEISHVITPTTDVVGAAARAYVKASSGVGLRSQLLQDTEHPSIVATPCWTCTNTACRDALAGARYQTGIHPKTPNSGRVLSRATPAVLRTVV